MVTCLSTLRIRETILTPCFRTRNRLRVLTIACKSLVLSELKFLLTKSDLIPRPPSERDDRLRVNVRETRKDLLLEREQMACILLYTL